jgi:hypothetical protein
MSLSISNELGVVEESGDGQKGCIDVGVLDQQQIGSDESKRARSQTFPRFFPQVALPGDEFRAWTP